MKSTKTLAAIFIAVAFILFHLLLDDGSINNILDDVTLFSNQQTNSEDSPEYKKGIRQAESKELARIAEINPKAAEDVKSIADALENGYGRTAPIKNTDTPNVQSVMEAIKTKKYPERITPAIVPKAFDRKAFTNNVTYKKKYMDTVEPGRVWQALEPGKGVPKIERISPYYQEVTHGSKVQLKVKALAGKPVTFTSFDLGMFGNQLTSQTVLSDSSGVATVEFHGMKGTIADTKILCSCPVTSGQLKFIVNTKKKKIANSRASIK